MTALPAERCNRCRFWIEDMKVRDPADKNFGFGHCRFRPPVVQGQIAAMLMDKPEYGQQVDPELLITALYTASKFPATFSTDWCGSYEPIGGEQSPC